VLDDQLRPAFTTLVNATLDAKKAQELLSVALDTSAGTGADLQSVTDALAKAALGQNTAIGKLQIGLSQAELKTMDLDKITKYLSNRFQGQAKIAAESFAGKMDILKAKTEDAKEMIGKELVGALDAAFGNPEKYGSSIDVIGSKIANLIKGFGEFIQITKTGIQNPTLSPSSPLFESKTNLKVPFNPVSRTMDVKAFKEQLKLQADAKKLAASRLAAIAKEKALIAEQKKLDEDRKKLEKFSTVLDLDQIQIYAALQNKITDQEKLRLSLQMALLQGNATEAGKLATELVKSQLLTTDLASAIAKLPKALYPFTGWSKDIDLLIQQILLMMRLLSAMPTKPLGQPMTGTPTYYTDLAKTLVNTQGYLGMSESQIASERYKESAGRFGGMETAAPVTVINVNGATESLLNELRNGLIDSSASGSFSSINPNR
jgi:hypothetical protein